MSEELNQRVVDLEKRVRELEEAQASYVMRDKVNVDAQGIAGAIGKITSQEIDRWFKSRNIQSAL